MEIVSKTTRIYCDSCETEFEEGKLFIKLYRLGAYHYHIGCFSGIKWSEGEEWHLEVIRYTGAITEEN